MSRRHAGLNIYHEYDILADIAGGMPATMPRPGDWISEETRPRGQAQVTTPADS